MEAELVYSTKKNKSVPKVFGILDRVVENDNSVKFKSRKILIKRGGETILDEIFIDIKGKSVSKGKDATVIALRKINKLFK